MIRKNLQILLFFALSFNYTFGQTENKTFIEGELEDAIKSSKENNSLVLFIYEGTKLNGENEEHSLKENLRALYIGLSNNEYTFFPTKPTIYYKRSNLDKPMEVWIFLKGKIYEIKPELFENRDKFSKSAYHPLEIWENKFAITREFATDNFKDSRDNQQYKFITINYENGEKVSWMTENLNFKSQNSKIYDNDEKNRKIYGLLYTRKDANSSCPNGWFLPTENDWLTLAKHFGGEKIAGKYLKSTKGWWMFDFELNKEVVGIQGNNISTMNILPGGEFNNYKNKAEFEGIRNQANFWTNTKTEYNGVYRYVSFWGQGWKRHDVTGDELKTSQNSREEQYYSCRCIKK